MSTLIAVYNRSGECVGRCDERCYNAKHPKCECICGGRNHGVGLLQALQNNLELIEDKPESDVSDQSPRHSEVLLPLPL